MVWIVNDLLKGRRFHLGLKARGNFIKVHRGLDSILNSRWGLIS